MPTYHSFDPSKINAALDAVRKRHEGQPLLSEINAESPLPGEGHFSVVTECISVTVEDGKVCLNLPFHFGRHCLPIPSFIPDGTVGKACLTICTKFHIPTGIKVTVEIAGKTVVSETFGYC